MKITLAELIRIAAGNVDITSIGKQFLNTVTEYGTVKKKEISPSNKVNWSSVTGDIADKSLAILDAAEGHGIAKEKAVEVRKSIQKLKEQGNPVKLLDYLKNFSLAWKAPSFSG
jgi:hypothetical protein